MKAVQIQKYSKDINTILRDIPIPEIGNNEVLVKVKAAAVNPLELLILTGSVKLIQDYSMPLTLGNECSGVVEKTGADVTDFQAGDKVYTRLPIKKIGAFAEYAAVDQSALAKMAVPIAKALGLRVIVSGNERAQNMTGQLRKITEIVEKNHIVPKIDSHMFTIDQANEALRLVAQGHTDGKVLIRF